MFFDSFISGFPKYGLVDLTWLLSPRQEYSSYFWKEVTYRVSSVIVRTYRLMWSQNTGGWGIYYFHPRIFCVVDTGGSFCEQKHLHIDLMSYWIQNPFSESLLSYWETTKSSRECVYIGHFYFQSALCDLGAGKRAVRHVCFCNPRGSVPGNF